MLLQYASYFFINKTLASTIYYTQPDYLQEGRQIEVVRVAYTIVTLLTSPQPRLPKRARVSGGAQPTSPTLPIQLLTLYYKASRSSYRATEGSKDKQNHILLVGSQVDTNTIVEEGSKAKVGSLLQWKQARRPKVAKAQREYQCQLQVHSYYSTVQYTIIACRQHSTKQKHVSDSALPGNYSSQAEKLTGRYYQLFTI